MAFNSTTRESSGWRYYPKTEQKYVCKMYGEVTTGVEISGFALLRNYSETLWHFWQTSWSDVKASMWLLVLTFCLHYTPSSPNCAVHFSKLSSSWFDTLAFAFFTTRMKSSCVRHQEKYGRDSSPINWVKWLISLHTNVTSGTLSESPDKSHKSSLSQPQLLQGVLRGAGLRWRSGVQYGQGGLNGEGT